MEKTSISRTGLIVGLSPKTIRYYEDIGLIKPAAREVNGYRLFSSQQLEELGIIKKARDLGLSINEIRRLLNGCTDSSCHHQADEIISDIDQLIVKIDQKISQFSQLKQRLLNLKRSTGQCSSESGSLCCNLLYQLVNGKGGGNSEQVL